MPDPILKEAKEIGEPILYTLPSQAAIDEIFRGNKLSHQEFGLLAFFKKNQVELNEDRFPEEIKQSPDYPILKKNFYEFVKNSIHQGADSLTLSMYGNDEQAEIVIEDNQQGKGFLAGQFKKYFDVAAVDGRLDYDDYVLLKQIEYNKKDLTWDLVVNEFNKIKSESMNDSIEVRAIKETAFSKMTSNKELGASLGGKGAGLFTVWNSLKKKGGHLYLESTDEHPAVIRMIAPVREELQEEHVITITLKTKRGNFIDTTKESLVEEEVMSPEIVMLDDTPPSSVSTTPVSALDTSFESDASNTPREETPIDFNISLTSSDSDSDLTPVNHRLLNESGKKGLNRESMFSPKSNGHEKNESKLALPTKKS